jgi:hypothetical protein
MRHDGPGHSGSMTRRLLNLLTVLALLLCDTATR